MADENDKAQETDANGGGDSAGDEGQTDRTFTQQDIDRLVAERLNRERAKYADYDDLKETAAKWADHEAQQKSDLEKLQDELATAQAEKVKAEQLARETKIQAAFIEVASKAGVANPSDAYALADRSGVTVGDDGQVVGAVEAVKALVDANRLPMAGKQPAPSLNGGAGSGKRPSGEKPLTADELAMAKRMGVTAEDYAKYKVKHKE